MTALIGIEPTEDSADEAGIYEVTLPVEAETIYEAIEIYRVVKGVNLEQIQKVEYCSDVIIRKTSIKSGRGKA